MPVPHRMVELKQFVIPPGQINVALFRRRTIGIEHYIDEGHFARPAAVLAHSAGCVERHFVLLESGRQLPDDALRPVNDEAFGLLNTINANSGAGPHTKFSMF